MLYCDQILQYNDAKLLELRKRLYLNKIHFWDSNNSEKLTYEFEYNPEIISNRFSKEQDFWGFYNGKDNSVLVLGHQRKNRIPPHLHHREIPDRQIDQLKSQAGILKKIKYPTGGFSEYEFENNRGVFAHRGILFEGNTLIPHKENSVIIDVNDEPTQIINNEYYIYEKTLKIEDDIINYFTPAAFSNDLSIELWFKGSASNCTYNGSLPPSNGCSIHVELKDQDTNEIISSGYLNSSNTSGATNIKMGDLLLSQLYEKNINLKMTLYKGKQTGPIYDFISDSFNIGYSWYVYDPETVKYLGHFQYEIPVGGLRTKSITTKENTNSISSKRIFSYKNESGIESGIYDVKLNNFIRFSAGVHGHSSMNSFPLQMAGGKTVIYENFMEKQQDSFDNSQIIEKSTNSHFYPGIKGNGCHYIGSNPDFASRSTPCFQHPLNGLPYQEKLQTQKTTDIEYNTNGGVSNPNLKTIEGIDLNTLILAEDIAISPDNILGPEFFSLVLTGNIFPFEDFFYYKINQFYDEPVKTVTTTTHLNHDIVERTDTQYHQSYPFLPIETTATNSLGESLKTEYTYPQDGIHWQTSIMNQMVQKNMISTPVITKTSNNGRPVSEQVTEYQIVNTNQILPQYVFMKKGSNPLDLKITYDSYDSNGNLTQYTTENGTPVSIIWGYNGQYPIAKIEGALYTSLSTYISTLQPASNGGTLTESSFDSLRNLTGAIVTCYIYKPLVGVTTIIQPNGQKEIYEYDASGRLMHVKDHQGNILKKMDYHYKNQ